MKGKSKYAVLLSPLLVALLDPSASQARASELGSQQTESEVNTAISTVEVAREIATKELRGGLSDDELAAHCDNYTVDSSGGRHCSVYHDQTATPSGDSNLGDPFRTFLV